MKKISASARSAMLKAVCTAMVIVLGGCLFVAGAVGAEGCGMKCCCQIGPAHMQPPVDKQMRSAMGCCAGVPLSSCDLQSARPFELPETILVSCGVSLPNGGGAPMVSIGAVDESHNAGVKFISQVLEPKFNPPPLFLQNLTFLI
jgi:hypothetical protein